jgi:hypothetical protein
MTGSGKEITKSGNAVHYGPARMRRNRAPIPGVQFAVGQAWVAGASAERISSAYYGSPPTPCRWEHDWKLSGSTGKMQVSTGPVPVGLRLKANTCRRLAPKSSPPVFVQNNKESSLIFADRGSDHADKCVAVTRNLMSGDQRR